MTKQVINVGTAANDKKGDSLRAAFQKVNTNFTELYTELGLVVDANLNLGAFEFAGSTISTTDSTAIVIDQATTITSNLSVGGDILPQTANGGDLGSSTLPWRSLYVSNNTIYIGGTAVGVDSQGNLLVGGQAVADVGTAAWNSITGKPTFATVATSGAYSDLTGRPTSFNSLVTGAYSVNLESGGVLRANVQGIVSDNQLAVEGSTLISIQTLDGPYLQLFNQGATKEINLVLYDGESLNPTWSFDTDRTLTLPNDSSIKSATNIDITVDTPDSSTFNWRFGADGALTLPSVGKISNGAYDWTFGSTGNLTFPQGTLLGYSDPGGFIIDGAVDKDIAIYTYNGADAHGWTFGTDGSLTIPGDIRSEGNINIDINLSDSTLRRWQFGEDGALTLPPGGTILTSSGLPFVYGITSINSSVATGIFTDASGDYQYGTLSYDYAVNGVTSGGFSIEYSRPLVGGNVDIHVGNTIVNGDLTLSGDIKSDSNINIDINLADSTLRRWQFGEDGHLTLPAGGDIKDSTGTSVLGGGGSVSSLVNGAYTVSLGSTGTLTVPASGIITTTNNEFFKLQAKDSNSLLRNEIKLDPNNGTYMSVWSEEIETSYNTSDWATGSWNNEDGLGAARFTGAEDLQAFWTTGPGSFVESVEVSINGGARGLAGYEGNNGGGYGVYLSVDQVPPGGQGTTVPITSLVFYYRTKNRIDIDRDGGQLLLNTQYMNINLETNSYINLKSTRANPVRIITNNNTHMWEFDSTGSLTLPREGKIYGIGDAGPGGNRYGYISWDGNSSGDGSGYNTMRLVPDLQGLEAADQYIILDPTAGAPGHIHIRAGGTQDNSGAHLYLGGEHSNVKISAGLNPPVTVMANDNAWTFGTSGDLTIPGDIKGTANTSIIVDNVVLFANVTVEQAQPYGPSGSRVFISASAYPTLGSLVQVGDTVTIGWGAPITVTITDITGGGFWELRFNQIITAELILNPGTITITSAQVNTWTFDNDGGLTFPDGTVQTTAWTGTFSTLSVTGAVTAERFNTDQITAVGNRISTTVTNANLELECNGSGGVVINAVADATTASTVKSVGYLGLPQSATATSGTLAISDAGKHIYVTTNGQAITIPDNSSVAYPIGTTLTFIAGPSATTVLIVINTDTLRLAGSSSTGTRTLAANGMATAVKVASTLWYINGTGLT